MSKARQIFYESISAFSHALKLPVILSKDPITERQHNERARMLRNGLAITGFVMIEEFVKARTGEVLTKISSGVTPFLELPERIREAAVFGVIKAVAFQSKFLDKSTQQSFFQKQAAMVSSTSASPYSISELSFCNNYVNLSTGEVEYILDAFRIDNPWGVLGGIINRLSLGVLAPKQALENAAARRHLAAHQISANIEFSDLQSYHREAIAFCLAYDLLISKALKLIIEKDVVYLKQKKLAGSKIEIRYLRPVANKWREEKEGVARAVKTEIDFETLKADCLVRAKASGTSIIIVDEKGTPVSWFTPEVDF